MILTVLRVLRSGLRRLLEPNLIGVRTTLRWDSKLIQEERGASHSYMVPEKKKEIIDTLHAFNGMASKEHKTSNGYRYNQKFLLVRDVRHRK